MKISVAEDDFRPRPDAHGEGLIRGRVAGMQRHHHLEAVGRHTVEIALAKLQSFQREILHYAAAELHEVLAQFDAGDLRLDAQGVPEQVMQGKGQISFSGPEVHDVDDLLPG